MSRRYHTQIEVIYDPSEITKDVVDIRVDDAFADLAYRVKQKSYHAETLYFETETELGGGETMEAAHMELRSLLGPEFTLRTRWKCLDITEWDAEFDENYREGE